MASSGSVESFYLYNALFERFKRFDQCNAMQFATLESDLNALDEKLNGVPQGQNSLYGLIIKSVASWKVKIGEVKQRSVEWKQNGDDLLSLYRTSYYTFPDALSWQRSIDSFKSRLTELKVRKELAFPDSESLRELDGILSQNPAYPGRPSQQTTTFTQASSSSSSSGPSIMRREVIRPPSSIEDPLFLMLLNGFGQKIAEQVYLNSVIMTRPSEERLYWEKSGEAGLWHERGVLPITHDIKAELFARAGFVMTHEGLWRELTERRPRVCNSPLRQKEFAQHLSGIYRCPEFFSSGEGHNEMQRLERVEGLLRELIRSGLSDADVDFLLGVMMKQLAPGMSFHFIEEGSKLSTLREQIKQLVRRNVLIPDPNYQVEDKSRFLIRSEGDRVLAKYKPLEPVAARNEQIGYMCDQILGSGMTCSTKLVSFSMENELRDIAFLYRIDPTAARERFSDLPENIQMMIYFAVFKRVNPSVREVTANFGEDYFWGRVRTPLTGSSQEDDSERQIRDNCSTAILNVLNMRMFKQWQMTSPLEMGESQGVIQFWKNGGAIDVKELLINSSASGTALRQIPVTVCHWYALLGLVKGAYDGHLGNTLFIPPVSQASSSSVSISSDEMGLQSGFLMDCDDEMILAPENTYANFRMWQFGLPQNAIAFSKIELQLIVDSDLLGKIKKMNQYSNSGVPSRLLRTQEQRIERMIDICRQELLKDVPTLSPRELFFQTMRGGRGRFDHYANMGYAPIFIFDCLMLAEANEDYYRELMAYPEMSRKIEDLYRR